MASPVSGVEETVAMVQRTIRICAALLELGWLAAVVAVPSYFNFNDQRAFEPDKAILVRDLAAVLAVLALLRLTCSFLAPPPRQAAGLAALPRLGSRVLGAFRQRPTLAPMLGLAAVTLLST